MKTSSIFHLLISVWSIDFFTTIIALRSDHLFESNFIANYFFSFGLLGYMAFFIVTSIILFLASVLIFKLSNYRNNTHSEFIQAVAITIFYILEVQTILNNVRLL